jgi:hypothetical protein
VVILLRTSTVLVGISTGEASTIPPSLLPADNALGGLMGVSIFPNIGDRTLCWEPAACGSSSRLRSKSRLVWGAFFPGAAVLVSLEVDLVTRLGSSSDELDSDEDELHWIRKKEL